MVNSAKTNAIVFFSKPELYWGYSLVYLEGFFKLFNVMVISRVIDCGAVSLNCFSFFVV